MKKIIYIFIICLIVISSTPINSLAYSFEPDLTLEYTDFDDKSNTQAQAKLQEAEQVLNVLGTEVRNSKKQTLNYRIYAMYGVTVYDFPSFDNSASADKTVTGRIEYRYLGTDYQGQLVTNDLFPNDATGTKPLEDKNWQIIDPKMVSWKGVDDDMVDYILYRKPIINDGVSIDYCPADILIKKTTDKETLKKYILLQTAPAFSIKGSIRVEHVVN